MAVVFLPDNTEFNPYQANLADALDEDVVFGGESRYLPILDPVRSREGVSVVHFHWLHLYLSSDSKPKTAAMVLLTVAQLLVVRSKGIPMVWTVHNVISHESPYPRLERWFKHGFVRFGFCAHLFVHCEDVENRIVEEYRLPESVRQRISVIPHGHYLDNYENEISRDDARSSLGFDDETVFLFFGLIKPYKGVFELIDAFGSIDEPEYRLLIVGNPLTESIEREIEALAARDDRIGHVLEFVPDDEIQRYTNAADVVVLPYTEITTSGSVILTMSFGRPVIVPRLGCIPDTVDEEGALLYPPEADDGLRSALADAKHRDLPAMGAHNLELVRQYDWSDIADRTARVYSRVTGDARTSRVSLS